MTIRIVDSASAMAQILHAEPGTRADLVRDLWAPMAGMYHFVEDGLDLCSIHRQHFGFDWEHPSEELFESLRILEDADAWTRLTAALETGIDALQSANQGLVVPDLTVLLILGDPDNEHFVSEVQGMSAFGGISGYIIITVWPTRRVLDRLEAIAVHELHHTVRYSAGGVVWDPATVTVGEHVIAEGLADTFAAELYGDAGWTHFVSEATRADDRVLAQVVGGLDTTGMQHFAGWVLGDATARLFGGDPVGLPTGAGYAAGARLVAAYIEATGTPASQNVHTPASDILLDTLPRLGFARSARD